MRNIKHTIYDHEIKSIKEASDYLFCPQDDYKMDHRTAYQTIHHILEDINNRTW